MPPRFRWGGVTFGGMKQIMLLAALAGAGQASAAGWEYATFLLAPSQYEWLGPKNQKVLSANFSQIITKMGCKLPNGANSGNYVDLLNCVGTQGWELVAIKPEPTPDVEQWFFKRPKK